MRTAGTVGSSCPIPGSQPARSPRWWVAFEATVTSRSSRRARINACPGALSLRALRSSSGNGMTCPEPIELVETTLPATLRRGHCAELRCRRVRSACGDQRLGFWPIARLEPHTCIERDERGDVVVLFGDEIAIVILQAKLPAEVESCHRIDAPPPRIERGAEPDW